MLGPIVPLIAGSHVLVAASNGPPKVDIQATCRISSNEVMKLFGDTTPAAHFDSCMRSQSDALKELEKNWATYPAEDKQQCARPKSYMPSYVEWLTCFEMAGDVRRFRAENAKAAAPPTRKRKGQ
jgi:hypothetical protein